MQTAIAVLFWIFYIIFTFYKLYIILCQKCLYIRTESIHALAMLRKPVHYITVVGSHALLIAFAVADNVFLGETILFAEVNTEVDGFLASS